MEYKVESVSKTETEKADDTKEMWRAVLIAVGGYKIIVSQEEPITNLHPSESVEIKITNTQTRIGDHAHKRKRGRPKKS